MHSYDYRCNDCQHRFSLHYKTYADYDAATPICPECDSMNLSRIISKVTVHSQAPQPRDYRKMSGEELEAVVHSPRPRETGAVFQQMIEHEKDITPEFEQVTDRLLQGENIKSIEQDVHVPDKVPEGYGLAKELLSLKIRQHEHDTNHPHDHDPGPKKE